MSDYSKDTTREVTMARQKGDRSEWLKLVNAARGAKLLELEAQAERDRLLYGPPNTFTPGDRVVLTATACRMWATVMGFPVSKSLTMVWTVVACECALCKRGDHVCTDEVLSAELGQGSDAEPQMRHISVMQLKRRGEVRADDGMCTAQQPSLGAAVTRAAKGGRR